MPQDNKQFTEYMYSELRKNDDYKYKGYAGFAFSYSGKWLGGWCRDGLRKRDYVAEAYKNALNQSPLLQGIRLLNKSYSELVLDRPCVIYCDPPYRGATSYKTGSFDHEKFWEWCRYMTAFGHQVFISEYSAPEDFECIWGKEQTSSLTKNTGSKIATEKLFKYILP